MTYEELEHEYKKQQVYLTKALDDAAACRSKAAASEVTLTKAHTEIAKLKATITNKDKQIGLLQRQFEVESKLVKMQASLISTMEIEATATAAASFKEISSMPKDTKVTKVLFAAHYAKNAIAQIIRNTERMEQTADIVLLTQKIKNAIQYLQF